MPTRITPDDFALINSFADRGDHLARLMIGEYRQTYWCSMTPGVEGAAVANTIRISGQITNQAGEIQAGIFDVFLKSVPVAGAGTMTVVAANGTLKAGTVTKELWLQTIAAGTFQVDVLNASVEDTLIIATVDNGEAELLKITFA